MTSPTPMVLPLGFQASTPLLLRPSPALSRRPRPAESLSRPQSPSSSRLRATPRALIPPGNNLPRRLPQVIETALLINVVPFLWGSYAPAVKLFTNFHPHIPLTFLNVLTTGAALLTLQVAKKLQPPQPPARRKGTPFGISAELGAYMFFGAWFHLRSVALTTASRSSFFIQLSTLFVPIIEYVLGRNVSRAVIPPCLLTLVGAFCLALPSDGSLTFSSASSLFSSLNTGDVLAMVSAFCYSMHIVRLEPLTARAGNALNLVTGQIRAQMVLASSFVMVGALSGDPAVPNFVQKLSHVPVTQLLAMVGGLFWIGGATHALAAWAQALGQQRVGASRAAVFYASQPVWAVGLTFAAGIESLTTQELIGGLLIVGGSLLLAFNDNSAAEEGA